MTEPAGPSLAEALRLVAAASPRPWYPAEHARVFGLDRDRLDREAEQLRLAGLVTLTDWEKGRGQGYALTAEGRELLASPAALARLARGAVPAPAAAFPTADRAEQRRGAEVQAAWENRGVPRLTLVLLTLNLGWFAVGALLARRAGVPTDVFLAGDAPGVARQLGSVTGPDLLHGDGWRLVASCFVHHGWMHLASNLVALVSLGPLAEQIWGRWRYLAVYLLSGLGGSVVAMAYNPVSNLAGASGALFGLLGSVVVWVLLHRRHLPEFQAGAMARALVAMVILSLVAGGVFEKAGRSVSHAGHLGGAATGAVAALLLT